MEIISDYYYMPYPYVSKSSLATYKVCKYKFLRTVIQGVDPQQNRMMAEGTASHILFNKFFDIIVREELEKLDHRDSTDTQYSPVYNYFLQKLYSITPPAVLSHNVDASIKAFARMEENHWYSVRETYKNSNEAWRYFYTPVSEREKNLVNEEYMLFGTYDRLIHEGDKIILSDYKTGKRPEKLVKEQRDTCYTKELPNRYVREGNMYVLLYILSLGYKFRKGEDGKWHFYTPSGAINDTIVKRIDYQTIFLGNDFRVFPAYSLGRKKSSMRSMQAIVEESARVRECTEWPREPFYKKCNWCHLYEPECREVIELEIYRNLQQSESTTEEDIFFDD